MGWLAGPNGSEKVPPNVWSFDFSTSSCAFKNLFHVLIEIKSDFGFDFSSEFCEFSSKLGTAFASQNDQVDYRFHPKLATFSRKLAPLFRIKKAKHEISVSMSINLI